MLPMTMFLIAVLVSSMLPQAKMKEHQCFSKKPAVFILKKHELLKHWVLPMCSSDSGTEHSKILMMLTVCCPVILNCFLSKVFAMKEWDAESQQHNTTQRTSNKSSRENKHSIPIIDSKPGVMFEGDKEFLFLCTN